MKYFSLKRLESFISTLLKGSICLSVSIVLLGGSLYLYKEWNIPVKYHIFLGEPKELTSVSAITKGALGGNPVAIIQLGVILLILTPLLRVIFCSYYFLCIKDRLFFLFSCFLAFLLLSSLFGFIS